MTASSAQKVKALYQSEDRALIRDASVMISKLKPSQPKLRETFLALFKEALTNPEYDGEELELAASCSLHSLGHSQHLYEQLWEGACLSDPAYFMINAAWGLSYACGLWDRWGELGVALPISADDYDRGELAESPLLPLLRGRHIRLISPLDPLVLKMIQELRVVGVASIKLDSLCDEELGSLIDLGDETLELLRLGAERAERCEPTTCVARSEQPYTRWVSTTLAKHKLKGTRAEAWRFVLLRSALAKTMSVCADGWEEEQLKLVYCPVRLEAEGGLWVARSPQSDSREAFMIDKAELPQYLNGLSRSRRYKLIYKIDKDNEELDVSSLDLSKQGFRLATLEELLEIGRAGDPNRALSGADHPAKLLTRDDDSPRVALHSANAWGVYDVGVLEEFVWDQEAAEASGGEEFFCEYIRTFGDPCDPSLEQYTRDPERHRRFLHQSLESCIRVVLSA